MWNKRWWMDWRLARITPTGQGTTHAQPKTNPGQGYILSLPRPSTQLASIPRLFSDPLPYPEPPHLGMSLLAECPSVPENVFFVPEIEELWLLEYVTY